MKSILTLIQLANLVISQDVPQGEEKIRRLPGAIVYGVRKAGTRAILEFLRIHPSIAAAKREIHFFDRNENYYKNYVRGTDTEPNYEWYKNQMPYSTKNQITMEKTPRYFVVRRAPKRIEMMDEERTKGCTQDERDDQTNFQCRKIKLILVVRDPVDRLISDYTQIWEKQKKNGGHHWNFEQIVLTLEGELNRTYPAITTSLYDEQYSKWTKKFSPDQLFIADGNELKSTPWITMNKIEKFLGLENEITQNDFVRGTRGYYCIKRQDTNLADKELMRCLNQSKGRAHYPVSESLKSKLRRLYQNHNSRFEKSVGMEFHWKQS